tara:strand:+ start:129052 stop:132897 length:3846 start_codon:yes stop_codon:yes gene_type:complete
MAALLCLLFGSTAASAPSQRQEVVPDTGAQNWLEEELANFRKYPFLERAERLIGTGHSVEAANELERVLAVDPEDVDVRLRLVILFLGPLDDPQSAAEHATKLIEIGREPGLGHHYRALAKLRLGAAESAADDWRRALDAEELDKDRQRYIRRQLADIAIQRGDFAAVPPLFEEHDADQVFEDRLRLIRAYINLGRSQEALQMLMLAAFGEHSVPPEAWRTIAQFQLDLGQPALAAVTMNRGLSKVESVAIRRELASALGHLHMARSELEQATQAFAMAAREGDPEPELYLAWAQALTESGLVAQALEVVETVEQTSPYGRRLHAQLLGELGRPEDAAQIMKRLLEAPSLQEDRGAVALEVAELHAKAGDLAAQLTALQQAVALSPNHAPALRALAERLIGEGQLQAASDTLRALVAVEDQADNRLRLVDVLIAANARQSALDELPLLAERMPPDHPERLRVLRQWADLAEAEQAWIAAAQAWEALFLAEESSSPRYLLQAVRSARLGGQPVRARQLIVKLDIARLEPEVRALFLDERAQIALSEGETLAAAQWQQDAVHLHASAERHFIMAEIWKALGEPDKARKALQEAIILAPNNAEYHASLGYLSLESGDPELAAEHFGIAVANEGALADLRLEQVQALRRAGKIEQALDLLESTANLPVYGTRLKGQLLRELGRVEAAEQVLAQLLDEPGQVDEPGAIALEIADMHAQAGDSAAQLAALERAAQLAPNYPPALHALAERQVGSGDLVSAAKTQKHLLALRGDTETHVRLVDILVAANDHAAALSEMHQLVGSLLPKHPDLPMVLRKWAKLAEAHGLWATAAQAWEMLYNAEGTRPGALMLNAGRAARLAGQHERASQMLAQIKEHALALDQRALLYEELARLASLDGDLRQAAEAQRRSVLTKPTADRHYALGQYLLKLGEQLDARNEFEQAVLLAPENAEFRASLGYVYLGSGDDSLAADHFEAALAGDVQRLPLYEELGHVYRRLGQDEAAASAFRRRIDLAQTEQPDTERDDAKGSAGTDERGYAWRREVQQLEDRLKINTGLFVRRMNGNDASDPDGSVGLAGFRSQAGLDIAYRLDNVSDGRHVEVFGRSIWTFEDDTLSTEGSRTQGGVGLRAKPFAPLNFLISGERLVALGREARNDWMIRASASFDRGTAYAPSETYRHYRSVYLDAALVVEDRAEFLVGEWREGVAAHIRQGLNLTPYAIAGASYTEDIETEKRYEIGVGTALRGWFGGNAYRTHSSQLELALEYRAVVGGNTNENSGFVLRLHNGF